MMTVTTAEIDQLEWLEPWAPVEEPQREALERELKRELIASHVLFGRNARAIARSDDEVLFALDGPSELAVVHLTYVRETRAEWPQVMVFPSVTEFVEGCMKPDHEELVDDDVD